MMEQKMPFQRFRNYLGIAGTTVFLSFFFLYRKGMSLDDTLTFLLLDLLFLSVLLYALESSRLHHAIGSSATNRYDGIFKWHALVCLLAAGCSFLPEFTFPAAFASLFLTLASNAEIGIGLSTFSAVLLCAATERTFYEMAAYCLLFFFGAQMAKAMHHAERRLWGCVILYAVSVSVPALFSYLAYGACRMLSMLVNGMTGAVFLLLIRLLLDRLYDKIDHEEWDSYESIVREDYPLVRDIKKYSMAEYVHAIKVATVAGKCAAEIGADELLATAAGFYYRLGILEGEPFIANGVRLACENCFPEALVQILSEYNGEERLPSSKESAIVHMVDACIKRMELLSAGNLSSSWNQDMVIYQTLNELSASGIYDASGVSMNQFLKVRELLVREEIGYDSND